METDLRRSKCAGEELIMCNFLRRPSDYGGTSSHGYMDEVVVTSSIPNTSVSYSTSSRKPRNASLIALRVFVETRTDDMEKLKTDNEPLYLLLHQIVEECTDGL